MSIKTTISVNRTSLYHLPESKNNKQMLNYLVSYDQGPDFEDMSSFFPCEIDNEIQYINLGYGEQASKIIFLSYFQVLLNFPVIYSSFLNNYVIMVK